MKREKATQTKGGAIGRLLVLAGIFESVLSETVEVCISEDMRISCRRDEIIFVSSAEFGRMEVGKCIRESDQFLGCSNDVLLILDRWCSGRQQCSIEVTNDDELEKANKNCLKILMKYLKLEYRCLKVTTTCRLSQRDMIYKSHGYISSSTLETRGCGSSRSPWIITVNPGQIIQLDLIDFAARAGGHSLISCPSVYGFVVERALQVNQTVCGGRMRTRSIYKSKSNSVEIYFVPAEKRNNTNFLVKYSVTGCPEMTRPAHAWYKREGSIVVIGCENSDKEWKLKCVDGQWVGDLGNCSDIVPVVKEEKPSATALHVSSIVVISGIAGIAIVLSVIAVVIGVVYVNKYRMKQEVKRANLCKTYSTMGGSIQAYYRPVTIDQSGGGEACWDMTLFPEKCTCSTLQMHNQGNCVKKGERSPERQSLYSSIKST